MLNRQTNDIIALTYRYVASYAIYLGVKLEVFANTEGKFTASLLQELIVEKKNKKFNLSGIVRLLNTLCAYDILSKNNLDRYELTDLGKELCDINIQNGILQEFSDLRWGRVSKLTGIDAKDNSKAYDELFMVRDYSSSPALTQLLNGYQDVKMLQFAGILNVYEYVNATAQSSETLAIRCGVKQAQMQFLLEYLVKLNMLAKIDSGYVSTELSKTLRRDTNNLNTFLMHETPEKWLALGQLYTTLQTNEDAFLKANGLPLFDYLKLRPAMSQIFSEAMTSISTSIEIPAIIEPIKFTGTVMDMGGGEGKLLSAILAKNENATGIIFDLPDVLKQASTSERCQLRAGSFFNANDIPAADTIILKRVLHDWDDAKAITILQNCQAALLPGGRIIIIEYLTDSELMAKADLLMMAIGGQSRTSRDFIQLAEQAGLTYTKTVALTPMFSMIELSSLSLQNKATLFNHADSAASKEMPAKLAEIFKY